METFEVMGSAAAHLALRILAGEQPETIPIRGAEAPVFLVDWRQLRRWALDESRLPPGTVLQFRKPSLWEEYKGEAATALGVLLLQSLLIAALLLQARQRR